MTASLTTHVLDLASGRPAAGMTVELWRLGGDGPGTLVARIETNADGRCDAPLLAGETAGGTFELRFFVADYLGDRAAVPFLGVVPVRFGLDPARGHHHVPLLVSPFGYSTYRGS